MISIISGASGVGKTTYLATFISRFLSGKPLFGETPAPIERVPFVGLIVTDRRWETARIWFDKAGVEEGDRFRAYCLLDDSTFEWEKIKKDASHADLFEDALDAINPPPNSLVIVDPIALYLGGRLIDYSVTAAAIGKLSAVCVKRRVTALGTLHVPKARSDPKERFIRPQDRALGSTAIASYTNTQFYLIGPEETRKPYYVLGYVSHNRPGYEAKLVRDTDGLFKMATDADMVAVKLEEVAEQVEDDPLFDSIPPAGDEGVSGKQMVYLGSLRGLSRATVYRRLRLWEQAGVVEEVREGIWRRTDKEAAN